MAAWGVFQKSDIKSGTFFKLREVSLTYNVPKIVAYFDKSPVFVCISYWAECPILGKRFLNIPTLMEEAKISRIRHSAILDLM